MPSIEVINLSKVYRLYSKPVHRLMEALFRRPLHESYTSLDNVSFMVQPGQTLGIIGENGAGKSTLLKILAGTLTQSSGTVKTKGRVAALLELGAGFHQEFTGRQNIHLNASLLGLSDKDINDKEEKIIEFSELGEFIDRPIKTYSSGMVVRLAFSIATSVDPDILIVDEALSVGDQYFQEKCVQRMVNFRKQRKTILFCSHAMYLVNLLCEEVMWIENGCVREYGSATRVTAAYENFLREKSAPGLEHDSDNHGDESSFPVSVISVFLNGQKERLEIDSGEDLEIFFEYRNPEGRKFIPAVGISRNDGVICHAASPVNLDKMPIKDEKGMVSICYRNLPLLHGEYKAVVSILDVSGLHCYHRRDSFSFIVNPPKRWEKELGLVHLDHTWKAC
jgi:ABC-type polysaccharide/polyol phosphate transport system ATPase subunit